MNQLAISERDYLRERVDAQTDLYSQFGLKPGTQELTPLGIFLQSQSELEHQRGLEVSRAGRGGGGTPADIRSINALMQLGLSRDEAVDRVFGSVDDGDEGGFTFGFDEPIQSVLPGGTPATTTRRGTLRLPSRSTTDLSNFFAEQQIPGFRDFRRTSSQAP